MTIPIGSEGLNRSETVVRLLKIPSKAGCSGKRRRLAEDLLPSLHPVEARHA